MKNRIPTVLPVLVLFSCFSFFSYGEGNRETPSFPESTGSEVVTVQDSAGRFVQVRRPLERVVILWSNPAEEMRALGAIDRIVGIDQSTKEKVESGFYPELEGVPVIGTWDEPNYEAIAELDPDALIMLSSYPPLPNKVQRNLEPFGIPVVALDFYRLEVYFREVKTLGFMIGKVKEAEEYITYFQDMFSLIEERTIDIPAEERKKVYFEGAKTYQTYGGAGYGSGIPQIIRMAGGVDLYPDYHQAAFEIDPEDVALRNPAVIFKGDPGGYFLDSEEHFMSLRKEIMGRPELEHTTAVQTGNVFVLSWDVAGGARKKFGPVFLAPLLYPGLFQDLDPIAFIEEYLHRYQNMEFRGYYMYPKRAQ